MQINKAERGFSLLVAKPSETKVVHCGSHPSKYYRSPLLLNFSDETGTHPSLPQFMKVQIKTKER